MGAIYTASKTTHAEAWKAWRARGAEINATWIDEAGAGESRCLTDLWDRCIREAAAADCLILYREPGETLKGALVEAGAALGAGKPVLFVGDSCGLGSFLNHRLVERYADRAQAFLRAADICQAAAVAAHGWSWP